MDARRGCRRFGGIQRGERLRQQSNAGVAHPDSASYLRQTEQLVRVVEVSEGDLPTRDEGRRELGLDREALGVLGTGSVGGSDRLCEERWGQLCRVTNRKSRNN
jgi:hypothetical protein